MLAMCGPVLHTQLLAGKGDENQEFRHGRVSP
jgi:hypothetical protein